MNRARENLSSLTNGTRWLGFFVAWLFGTAIQLQQPSLWDAQLYAGLIALAVPLVLVALRLRHRFTVVLGAWVAPAVLAFALAGLHGSWRMAQTLNEDLEGVDIGVVGVVAELPKVMASGVRFVLAVESASQQDRAVQLPPRLSLGWYQNRAARSDIDQAFSGAGPQVKAGQRWKLVVRLKRPHGLVNPYGFDYELYLLENGIGATGYVREQGSALINDHAGFGLQALRQKVKDAIEAQVPSARVAGVLAGLTIGDQSAIEREDWDLFRTTGVAHLVSISGLHVTMFAWLASGLAQRLWRRSARAVLWWPARSAGLWLGLTAAMSYALFSGWGVPAQRTVWMLATGVALRALGRRWPWPMVLLAAAMTVTLWDPWALLQPGFWLSFVAVGLLLASNSGGDERAPSEAIQSAQSIVAVPLIGATLLVSKRFIQRLYQGASAGVRNQLVATVGLAPLSLLFFKQLSLVGLLANLVAIPLVSFVLTPLALAGVLLHALWQPAAWLVERWIDYLKILASWPGATLQVAAAPFWAQCTALLGAAVAVMPLPWRLRLLSLPLCLTLFFPGVERPPLGQFDLLALDVGQGTAVQIRTHKHLLLFDAGPQYSAESDAGQRVLLPVLQAQGERRIDVLMLSHSDTDHVGGAHALLSQSLIGTVHSSLPLAHPLLQQAQQQGVAVQRCEQGQRWSWDGVDFSVLHPQQGDELKGLRPNAMSCVLQVSSADGGARALLTGDIERSQESRLVEHYGEALQSHVLLVPHHGSKTSSSLSFLEYVKAQVAVVQSGYRNRFGHPAPEVLQRLRDHVDTVLTSPVCGAWHWASNHVAEHPNGQCQRVVGKRYWHATSTAEVP